MKYLGHPLVIGFHRYSVQKEPNSLCMIQVMDYTNPGTQMVHSTILRECQTPPIAHH
jgi:hypothetical protein